MTGPSDETEPPAGETPAKGSKNKAKPARPSFWRGWMRPHTPFGWIAEAALVLLLAAALGLLALRYGPLTTEARLLIEGQANGFQIGPLGKLHIRGVRGDLLRDFSVRQVTISDPKGVWFEADGLAVRWRFGELLWRRLHVQSITADKVTVFRQPMLTAQKPSKGPELSIQLDSIRTRLETEAAFSQTHAVYDAAGRFDQEARGATTAQLDMRSVLHPGDFLKLDLDLGRNDSLKLDADARESKGGGIAGSLGLDASQPFTLAVHLSGATSNGKIEASARSGSASPLSASGAWTPAGGRLSAHFVLAQSRWTRDWANALGPEMQIDLAAKRRDDATYDIDARLAAANLGLAAKGPVDVTRRSSRGLAASLVINNLAKVVPQPIMGRGQATGMLSGSLGDLRFLGAAQVANLEFLDYRLARVGGPVRASWRNRLLDIQADAHSSGAGGSGLIAAAGGPAPTGKIDLNGLPDGRVLIRAMSIQGRGMRIEGEGGQNLIGGGLTFKGQMAIPDVALVRPGAAGALDGSWSASQSTAPGAPWTFTVEAKGERFAANAGELDRLLGPEPRLAGTAGFVGDTVTFDKIALDGAKAQANAKGQWKLDGSINFALGWQAQGPFDIGPIEADGAARGQGALTGSVGAPKLALTSQLDALGLPGMTVKTAKVDLTFARTPEGGDGSIIVAGQTDYGAARARSDFRFLTGGLELSGLDVDAGGLRVSGDMTLADQGPSAANLTLAAGPGALLTEGQAAGKLSIVGAPGGATAALDLEAKGAVLRGPAVALASAKLTARGPLARLPYQVSADGAVAHAPFKIDGQGLFAADPHGYSVGFDGSGQLRHSDFRTLETAQVRMDQGDASARLRLALGGGRAEFDGRETAGATDVKAVLTGVDLSFLSEDFTGQMDADLTLSGRGKDLSGALNAALKNAHSRDQSAGLSIDGQIKAQLANDRLTVQSNLKGGTDLTSSANFVLPADASAAPFHLAVARDRPMQGHFEANGEIQPLWDLFLGGERTLGGMLTAKADFAGTIADPKITGRADLVQGRFEDYPTGLKLTNARIGAALNTDTISVDTFSASDGMKGTVSGEGQVSLARGGASNLLIKLNNFRLVDNDTATADTTGQVTVVRDADGKARIAGALEVVSGEINAAAKTSPDIPTIDVVETNRPFNIDEQLQRPPAGQPGVELDIALTAKRGLLVKGRGLNVDMSLDAKIAGTSAKPLLSGEARVVTGDYAFGGARFAFDSRGVVQLSNDPKLIRLDLTATHEDPTTNLTAVINIQGTAAKPQITLTSTPVLPNDEVLAQVLFGASASQLSPFQAAELASAVTSLASGGGFDVIGGLRNFARLDRLALVGSATTGTAVAGGKYIGDRVYVEVAGGGRDASYADVEYRITRNLSLASRLANVQPANTTNTTPGTVVQTGSSISIRWRRDFRDPAPKPPPAAVVKAAAAAKLPRFGAMLRFAANLGWMFKEWDFLDRFQAAADAGFEAVEYPFPAEHSPDVLARALRRSGLVQALMNLPAGDTAAGERGLAALPDRFEDLRQSVEQAMPYIAATGVRRLHLLAGIAEPDDARAQAAYRRGVAYAAARLAEVDVEVTIEAINPRDMPGYFLCSLDQAAALVGELGLMNLKLQFDLYHCQIIHGDVTRRLRRLMPLIGHVQVASVPSRREPDGEELNHPYLFELLDSLGYDGFVGCEYAPRGITAEGLGWLAEARDRSRLLV